MENFNDFKKYATKHRGISSINLQRFTSVYGSYISPTIIEERQLNVASMDVFSRLMMDRIIFIGSPIDDNVANIGAGAYLIWFGNFKRAYLIVDRIGTRVLRDPYTSKPYILFYTTKRVGGGIVMYEAIKAMKIAAS